MFKADLPGLKEEVTVEIEEDDRVLQVSVERNFEEEKNDTWHRVERSSGRFTRRFRLPENAKMDEVKASMENGVRTVTFLKVELTTNLLDIVLPISISAVDDATGMNRPHRESCCLVYFLWNFETGLVYKLLQRNDPEKFVNPGIDPPKGVLCYGPPGTGKTLLARVVANRTDACFIRVIGSELVKKYVGEGTCLVRELFQMARSKKACIVFFDELDAIGGARFDDGLGGDNEVQRTMLEIVNQLDGFDARGNIKVLMATNRPDTLNPSVTSGSVMVAKKSKREYHSILGRVENNSSNFEEFYSPTTMTTASLIEFLPKECLTVSFILIRIIALTFSGLNTLGFASLSLTSIQGFPSLFTIL
ncbi:unnamed protein product [Camellia sinensis]